MNRDIDVCIRRLQCGLDLTKEELSELDKWVNEQKKTDIGPIVISVIVTMLLILSMMEVI